MKLGNTLALVAALAASAQAATLRPADKVEGKVEDAAAAPAVRAPVRMDPPDVVRPCAARRAFAVRSVWRWRPRGRGCGRGHASTADEVMAEGVSAVDDAVAMASSTVDAVMVTSTVDEVMAEGVRSWPRACPP